MSIFFKFRNTFSLVNLIYFKKWLNIYDFQGEYFFQCDSDIKYLKEVEEVKKRGPNFNTYNTIRISGFNTLRFKIWFPPNDN